MKIMKAVFGAQGDKPARTILFPVTTVMEIDEGVRDTYNVTVTCLGAQPGEIVEIDRSSMTWDVAIKSENGAVETDNVTKVVDIDTREPVELIAEPFVVGRGNTGLRCVRMKGPLFNLEKVFDFAMQLEFFNIAEASLTSNAEWIGAGEVVEAKRLVLTNMGYLSFSAKVNEGDTLLSTHYISLGLLLHKLSLGQRRIYMCEGDEAEFARYVEGDLQDTATSVAAIPS